MVELHVPLVQGSRPRSLVSCQVTREESGGTMNGESILLNEQSLERELQAAIEENYAQAAKIRDSLRLLQEDSKALVLAANARFYNSFRNGDLAAMQGLWSKGDHVCVVHPGVSGISGHDLVMGSWEFVWADYEFPLEIEIKDVQVHVRGDVGYVTCIEMVNWTKHLVLQRRLLLRRQLVAPLRKCQTRRSCSCMDYIRLLLKGRVLLRSRRL